LRDLQDLLAYLLDTFGDGPAVLRFERQGPENEQVERALDQVGWFTHGSQAYLSYLQYDGGEWESRGGLTIR